MELLKRESKVVVEREVLSSHTDGTGDQHSPMVEIRCRSRSLGRLAEL